MPYKLNDILLSTYGFIPGRMEGEKIAVKGIFDLPKRIGDTHYDWAEINGVQPFVDADEIFLDGRTIYFQGILVGDKPTLKTLLNTFKTVIDAFNNVVPFETPYGSYCVLVNKVTPTFYNGGATVVIEFFEPEVGASCSIGSAPTIYESEVYSEDATKNNCASGYSGGIVTLTSPAGKFTSTVSQAAANLLAVQWVRDYKQDYANANGSCTINPTVYYNVKLVASLEKNDCAGGSFGTTVSYEVPAFKYSSLISQADADQQAQDEIDANFDQAYANTNGSCVLIFYNNFIWFERSKDDCGTGYKGKTFATRRFAGTFTSLISQADADAQAQADAENELSQAYVNANGTCQLILSPITLLSNITLKGTRTKKWRINTPVASGVVLNFTVFGVVLTYTTTGSDTPSTVVIALKNLINNTTIVQWNAAEMFPLSFSSIAKPYARSYIDQLHVDIDYYSYPDPQLTYTY